MKTTLQRNLKRILATLLLGISTIVATQVAAAPLVVSADGMEVTDSATGLIWRRCAEGMVFSLGACTGTASTFTHELALARARTEATATVVAWRLPSVKELTSIADKTLSNPAIDPVAFPVTPAGAFWSASPDVGDSYYAWVVNFINGFVVNLNYRGYSYYVRLVRAGQ
ncbi:MAG: hypothetical protein A3K04_00130 [Gallionellales bacterium RBG_16_56_9]|nr:MAG: hypothetical protein A3K04_00130 [Gallionellales bacterium RBG_16_56_9]